MRVKINPANPQPKLIDQAIQVLQKDGVIVYPTDTIYGLGCRLSSAKGIERIYQIKKRQRRKPLSFICANIQQVSHYAILSNTAYKLAKRLLPGPYTLILPASGKSPKAIQSVNHAVGIRIPDHQVTMALVEALNEPLVSTSANASGDESLSDPSEIEGLFGSQTDLVLDAGILHGDPSTILDFTGDDIVLVRQGAGEWPV